MAIPKSPTVVVIENDQSIYTPNVDSSVVGIVGFANKGPVDTPTLITSQNNLLQQFGPPESTIPGQGLEGALEILEATNQIYFVRAASSTATGAECSATIGFCAAVQFDTSSSSGAINTDTSSVLYSISNGGTFLASGIVSVASANAAGVTTFSQALMKAFDPGLIGAQNVYSYVDADDNIFLASKLAGSGTVLYVSASHDLSVRELGRDGDPHLPASAPINNAVEASGGTFEDVHLHVRSNYPGTGYNLSSLRDGSVRGLSIEVDNVSTRDQITVNHAGAANELFTVELSPSSAASVEFLLNSDITANKSDYVYATIDANSTDNSFTSGIPDQFGEKLLQAESINMSGVVDATATPRFVKLVEGTFSLANGDSGYSTTEAGDASDRTSLIGTATNKTGIYALDDDSLNISLAIVPGIADQSVQNALITLGESSKNFLALVAPPFGYSLVQDAINWMNGRDTRTAGINSSWVAVCWPWVQVFNYFAAADEWFDPAIFAARQCVFTDNVAEPWFAPAGFRRGRLTKPSDVEVALNQGDRDALYTNNINPINKEPQSGITVFGQKTAQREPTALDRINVRRLMIYIRKVLLQLGKPFQFEPNDQFTWELVEEAIRPFIDDLLARRAIVAGDVKCDSTTNTPLRVDRNELWCTVTIKPTKAAETIVFEVNLTNQSATVNG